MLSALRRVLWALLLAGVLVAGQPMLYNDVEHSPGLLAAILPEVVSDMAATPPTVAKLDALTAVVERTLAATARLEGGALDSVLSLTVAEENFVIPVLRRGLLNDTARVHLAEVYAKGIASLTKARETLRTNIARVAEWGNTALFDIDGTRQLITDQPPTLSDHGVELLSEAMTLLRSGERCRRTLRENLCTPNPCVHGRCLRSMDGFRCRCEKGFTGKHCGVDIDDCADNPCQNEGKCVDGVDSYMCECEEGFTGDQCQYRSNECSRHLCQNGADCTDTDTGFTCECVVGFSGDMCQTEQDLCASETRCKNGGVCENTHQGDGFRCRCPAGFEGEQCEVNIDECQTTRDRTGRAPCANGGKCVDEVAGYGCECAEGFSGRYCTIDDDDCSPNNPCENGAICIDGPGGDVQCLCPAGFQGPLCAEQVDLCKANPCKNGGRCLSRVNGYICQCPDAFEGPQCQFAVDACRSDPCTNGARCISEDGEFTCECPAGYEGDRCEFNVNECAENPCRNGAVCLDGVNSFVCECLDGWTGALCEQNRNDCARVPCFHKAICIDGINSFTCKCQPGWHGTLCESKRDVCDSHPCKNGGRCVVRDGEASCLCPEHFSGDLCEEKKTFCVEGACANGGKCVEDQHRFLCVCPPGFTGPQCRENVDDCASNPCANGGECVDGVQSFVCKCPAGFSGSRCEQESDPCDDRPCLNEGECASLRGHRYTCQCPADFTGRNCQEVADACVGVTCANGGSCNTVGPGKWECTCPRGFSGQMCGTNVDECAQQPCANGGRCIDGDNQFRCECQPGYSGPRCRVNTDDCAESPCQNGGTCVDEVNGYTCKCPERFSGAQCENSPWMAMPLDSVWNDHQGRCAAQGQTLCSLDQLCDGDGQLRFALPPPTSHHQYVAAGDYAGAWVALRTAHNEVCKTYRDLHQGRDPSWDSHETSTTAKGWAVCCPSDCEKAGRDTYSGAVSYSLDGDPCIPWPVERLTVAELNEHGMNVPLCRVPPNSVYPHCRTKERGLRPCAAKCGVLNVCEGPVNPCRNGGKCSLAQAGAGYTCSCAPGFTGKHCGGHKTEYALSAENWRWARASIVDEQARISAFSYFLSVHVRTSPVSVVFDMRPQADPGLVVLTLFPEHTPLRPHSHGVFYGVTPGRPGGVQGDTYREVVHRHAVGMRDFTTPDVGMGFAFYRVDLAQLKSTLWVGGQHVASAAHQTRRSGRFGIAYTERGLEIRKVYVVQPYQGGVHPLQALFDERHPSANQSV